MCLLAVISEQPTYGYEMARKLQQRGLNLVSDGSIYPSLSRLQKQGLVEGYLVEAGAGPARKYYRLANSGREALLTWTDDWRSLASGVDGVLNGGANG
jgi:PadR family transcriptional regulator, regulatory protein PadR